jgi:CheY-like chemotaxis protein/anti-sigma regulatory factor (Ser/Thr protein kinase)
MTPTAAVGRVLVVEDDRAFRHAISTFLREAGHHITEVSDGPAALTALAGQPFDVILLDIGLPGISGLDVLAEVKRLDAPPRVVMITADDTSETLLKAVRGRADRYVTKPFAPGTIVEVVDDVLAEPAATEFPIQVVSAKPEWVELVAPCTLRVANRILGFMKGLEADLPESIRDSIGQAFRELLSNAVEWGGHLDPARMVRISCIRAKRMLLYRIADPGQGFSLESLTHSAINNPEDDPLRHAFVREEKGLRPGGLGLAITRSLVDELIYNEARNEVVFVKYLD